MSHLDLDTELELIASSLLPSERLASTSTPAPGPGSTPLLEASITSSASVYSLRVVVRAGYPSPEAVSVEVKCATAGREEAEEWKVWAEERVKEWDSSTEYPLFQLLTQHFLPLLAPPSRSPSPPPDPVPTSSQVTTRHHVLVTSHHLLSPTKRKNLLSLASQLALTGFSKVGHPGIYYAQGGREELVEWLREVKSWNWLALRVRVAVEPVPGEGSGDGKGGGGGEGEKKWRGDWVELEKIGEALEWLRKRGRESLLLDIGMGGGS